MRLPKVVSVLNSEVTRLTGKKPVEAIKKKVVDAKSSTTNLRPDTLKERDSTLHRTRDIPLPLVSWKVVKGESQIQYGIRRSSISREHLWITRASFLLSELPPDGIHWFKKKIIKKLNFSKELRNPDEVVQKYWYQQQKDRQSRQSNLTTNTQWSRSMLMKKIQTIYLFAFLLKCANINLFIEASWYRTDHNSNIKVLQYNNYFVHRQKYWTRWRPRSRISSIMASK